ncbi:N-acetyltransferase [Echinicola pacifica]|uniref:N-acetyltransferase n=1 Tax=Echinicola pacifica TaxID=346377 RepID=A0A918Q099_9BACT|nr:GNAT family N-acetyltransferase [Echinicola pacifica]GGZ26574.1 N-acetyltransferase [Echinicola pacifica]
MSQNGKAEIIIREGSIPEILSISLMIPEFKGLYDDDKYADRLRSRPHLVLVAEFGGKLIGFKVGYEWSANEFYSWMVAVVPGFRNNGVANALSEVQEAWCKTSRYDALVFKTRNRQVDMICYALRQGFKMVEVDYRSNWDEARLTLKKRLEAHYG